jgi:hypothetical protein
LLTRVMSCTARCNSLWFSQAASNMPCMLLKALCKTCRFQGIKNHNHLTFRFGIAKAAEELSGLRARASQGCGECVDVSSKVLQSVKVELAHATQRQQQRQQWRQPGR